MIFLNLFVAIILQGFNEINCKENQILNDQIVDNFKKCWSKFDPEGTGFMKCSKVKNLLFKLGPPLGFSKEHKQSQKKQWELMQRIEVPTY